MIRHLQFLKTAFCITLMALLTLSCDEDENAISNNLRVLKATAGEDVLTTGDIVAKEGLEVELVFSHALNTSAFEGALSVDAPDFSITYDDTQSFVTIAFENLAFDASYNIALPAGAYGAGGEVIQDDYLLSFTTAEFVPPALTFTADPASVEEGNQIVLTASIDQPISFDVTVEMSFEGTAVLDTDYTITTQTLSITSGETSASATIDVLDDGEIESEETVVIGVSSIENAVFNSDPLQISLYDQIPKIILKGVMELDGFNAGAGRGRAVHLYVREDIPSLSTYGIGVANNGGGTDGVEYTFPDQPATAGQHILLVRDADEADMAGYFGDCFNAFDVVLTTAEMSQNGNDAIELFDGANVIETFGDADVDGVGQEWEYTDSWAYKLGGEWIYGGVGCTASADSDPTQSSDCEYPFCANDLQLQGVTAFSIGAGGGNGRSIHLRVNHDIADLSVYGIGIANNGGGSDGREINLPAISVQEGEHILFARAEDVENLTDYFESCINKFDHVIPNASGEDINFNGDDPFELYENDVVIETYGDVALDGTGELWEWTDSWAYKEASVWTYGGVGCATGAETNSSSSCPYTFCD